MEKSRSYDFPPPGESRVRPAASVRTEVWLRGNVRPLLGLAVLGLGLAMLAAVGVAAAGGPSWLAVLATAMLVAAVAMFAFVASRPRLARRGDSLLVRLAPFVVHRVPLDVVECVFHGSQPIESPATQPAEPQRRVGTLVIRLAERATDWRQRSTFAPWGTWQDGHIVCDGRWCEPLTVEVARGVGSRLLEAKRAVTATGAAS